MQLDRKHVTVASRVMLPAYAVLFAGLGLNYVVTSRARLTLSPTLAYADGLLPLPAWGVLFLCVAALMVAALLTKTRMLFRYGLWLGIVCMTIWAGVFASAAYGPGGDASPAAFLWPAFVATACYASNRSLLTGEV